MDAFRGPDAPDRALIDACVHCGFCLPSCPTYALWGEEMDSPRGRIYLMKAAVDGRAALSPTFVSRFDACLGCMACVTACPSGVQYGPLIERTRAQIEQHHSRPLFDAWLRTLLFQLLPYPRLLRLALMPVAVVRGLLTALAPARVRDMLALLPDLPPPATLAERTPAAGAQRRRVGVLTGCVQSVLFPHVNQATLRVLSAEGCEVIVPRRQGCCGALSRHAGRLDEARAFARQTIVAFERTQVDTVVVNAAGCGSSMKEYGELLAGDPVWAARAQRFSAAVRDVSELLVELGEPRAVRHPIAATVAYQDACHLAHAQGIRQQPRQLLAAIPGITLVDIAEPEMCCGSAGIYNVVQPEPAAALGDRKAAHIAAAQPDIVATGNPGCALQIAAAGRRAGWSRPVLHPIELLDRSISGATKNTGI